MGVNNMDRMIATRRLWESEAPRELGPGRCVQEHKRELSHLAQRGRRQDTDA